MDIVNYLSLLFGFSLIIVFMAMILKPKLGKTLVSITEDEKMLLLIGFINIILGIALILLHNSWSLQWTLIITLINWLILARGVLIIFFPDILKKVVNYFKNNINWMPFISLACIIIGCFLVFMGVTY